MNGPTPIEAVLFDFNGVLVDDERLHFECFNAVLAPRGIALSARDYEDVYLGFDDRGVFETALRAHGQSPDRVTVQTLIAAKAAAYATRAEAELRVFEGAPSLLRAVAARAPVVVVSGALRAEIDGALAVMRAADTVEAIVAAEDVSACKPDPEGYLRGLALLSARHGSVDPSRCVAVEDSTAGIAAACGAGLRVLAVAHTYPEAALRAAGAHAVAARLAEVSVAHLASLAIER